MQWWTLRPAQPRLHSPSDRQTDSQPTSVVVLMIYVSFGWAIQRGDWLDEELWAETRYAIHSSCMLCSSHDPIFICGFIIIIIIVFSFQNGDWGTKVWNYYRKSFANNLNYPPPYPLWTPPWHVTQLNSFQFLLIPHWSSSPSSVAVLSCPDIEWKCSAWIPDSIPPTMSTPPVNQTSVFLLSVSDYLPPFHYFWYPHPNQIMSFRHTDTTTQNKTFYQCLLYRGLRFNAMVAGDPVPPILWRDRTYIRCLFLFKSVILQTVVWGYIYSISLGNIFGSPTHYKLRNNCLPRPLEEVSMFYRKFNGQSLATTFLATTTVFNGHRHATVCRSTQERTPWKGFNSIKCKQC